MNNELTTNVKVRGAEEAARKIQSFRDKIDGAGSAASRSASGFGAGGSAASGFQRALSSVGGAVSSFAARVAGIAWNGLKAGAIAAATAVITLGAKGLSSAGQLQSLQISMNGLTGSMEAGSKAMATAYQYAQRAPFQLPEVAQTTKGLIAMGVEVEATGAALETIGGIAITSGAQITDIGRIYGQVFANGKLQLEDMNQLTDNGVGIQKALEEQLGVTSETVRTMASEGQISFDMFNKAMQGMVDPAILEQLNNTMPRQIDRLNGSVRQISNAFVGVGVDATNGFTMASNGVAQAATNLVRTVADKMRSPEILAAAAGIGNSLVPAINNIATAVGPILGLVMSIAGPVAQVGGILVTAFTSFITAVAPGLQSFFGVLGTALASIAPMAAQLGTALGAAFGQIMVALQPLIPPLMQVVGIIIQQLLIPSMPVVVQLFTMLASVLVAVLNAIVPILPPLMQMIVMILNQLGPYLPQFAALWIQLIQAIAPILPPLMQLIGFVLPLLMNLFLGFMGILIQVSGVMIGVLGGAISGAIGWISNIISWVGNAINWFSNLASRVGGAMSSFGSAISSGISNAINWFSGLPGRIMGAMSSLAGSLSQAGSNAINGFLNGITGAAGRVMDKAREIANNVANTIKDALNIHSPSRLTEYFGRMTGQGLVNGIDSMIGAAKAAATGMTDAVTAGLNSPDGTAVSGGTFTTNSAAADMIQASGTSPEASAGGNIIINFHGPVYMRDEEQVNNVGAQLARQLQAARAGAF